MGGLIAGDGGAVSVVSSVISSHAGDSVLYSLGRMSLFVSDVLFANLTVKFLAYAEGRGLVAIVGCAFDTDEGDMRVSALNVAQQNNTFRISNVPLAWTFWHLDDLMNDGRTGTSAAAPARRIFGGIVALQGVVVIAVIVAVLAYGAKEINPERVPLAIDRRTRATREEIDRRLQELDDPFFEF
jgi:hypothetical protein